MKQGRRVNSKKENSKKKNSIEIVKERKKRLKKR